MTLSNRTKRLLDWWTLSIRSTRNKGEVQKENVNTNHIDKSICSNDGNSNRGEEEVNDSSISNSNS